MPEGQVIHHQHHLLKAITAEPEQQHLDKMVGVVVLAGME
jgi:hypothetical protein